MGFDCCFFFNRVCLGYYRLYSSFTESDEGYSFSVLCVCVNFLGFVVGLRGLREVLAGLLPDGLFCCFS